MRFYSVDLAEIRSVAFKMVPVTLLIGVTIEIDVGF